MLLSLVISLSEVIFSTHLSVVDVVCAVDELGDLLLCVEGEDFVGVLAGDGLAGLSILSVLPIISCLSVVPILSIVSSLPIFPIISMLPILSLMISHLFGLKVLSRLLLQYG